MRALVLLLLLSIPALAEMPTGKAGKRIHEIETKFNVAYIDDSLKGKMDKDAPSKNFWCFAGHTDNLKLKTLAFAVPQFASDDQVFNCMISAMRMAKFYDAVIEKAAELSKQSAI